MKERLRLFLQAENINQARAAEITGITPATFSHILSGRSKPSCDFLESLAQKFPSLNIEWLLLGTGKMYKDQGLGSPSEQKFDSQRAEMPENTPQIPAPEPSELDFGLFSSDSTEEAENSSKAPECQNEPKKVKVKKIILLFEDNSYQIL